MDRGKRPIKAPLGASNNKIYMDLKDIIREQALPFLPAKSLFRFRGVCRDWKLQISTPFFAHNQSISCRSIMGLFFQNPGGPPSFISVDPISCGIPDPTLNFLPVPVDIRDSSNGLLCCQGRTGDRAYYVCNPVTKQWKKIPKQNTDHGPDPAIVLVFEPSLLNFEAEYKLICAFPSTDFDDAVEFEIYSSGDGSWKVSGEIFFANSRHARLIPRLGVQVNGVVYWQTQQHSILAFDLKKDRARLLQSYVYGYGGSGGGLAVVGGKLCTVSVHARTIVVSALSNVFSNTMEMTSSARLWVERHRVLLGGEVSERATVVFAGGDVVVVKDDEKMVCYDLKSKESKSLVRGAEYHARFVPYVNSLAYM